MEVQSSSSGDRRLGLGGEAGCGALTGAIAWIAARRATPPAPTHPTPKPSRAVRLRVRVHRGGGGGVLGRDDGGVGVEASGTGPRVSRASR